MPPGIFFVIFLFFAFKLYRREKKLALSLAAVTVIFYLLSTPLIGSWLVRTLESQYIPPTNIQGDVIILLGGGATADTPDVDGVGMLSGSAANRLLTAARLHVKTGLPIITSGGRVFSDSGIEAQIAKRQLMTLGVPESKIFAEDQSLNTQQNAQFTKRILAEQGFARPILVTSAFHMPRSVGNFARAGIEVLPYPGDYMTSLSPSFYANKLVPSAEGLCLSGIALKEYLGILAMRLGVG